MSQHYTGEHPPASAPDATKVSKGQPAPDSATSTELARLKVNLRSAIKQYPDWPSKGVLFEDILPIFQDPALHDSLIRALELRIRQVYGDENKPDVLVGLEARGFLFAPTLALRLGCSFVPARKKGKLPGPTVTAAFKKEYGEDHFDVQAGAIKQGQKVLIIDDIIATGGTAAAAGDLVHQLGGNLLGYVMLMELEFLHGKDKLKAPLYTLMSGQ